MQGIKNYQNYKKYVEEHTDDFKHKKLFSRHRDFSLVSPKISHLEIRNFDSMYTKSYTYFTEEPTEKPSGKNNYNTPISQTNPPAEIYTKCPSSLNSTTYIPTINFTLRNSDSTNNNNNNNNYTKVGYILDGVDDKKHKQNYDKNGCSKPYLLFYCKKSIFNMD